MNKTQIERLMKILVISTCCVGSTVNAQNRTEKQTTKQTLSLQIQNKLILQGETLRKRGKILLWSTTFAPTVLGGVWETRK